MIDLHVHSTASDGTFSPSELVELAKKNDVTAFALTDHDTFDGLDEAIAAADDTKIEVIPGIEFSLKVDHGTFHMLGLFIDYKHIDFQKRIKEIQSARADRTPKILKALNDLGINITEEDVINASGGGQIGRIHVANALVNKGWVATAGEAFSRYLAKGKAAYFPKAVLSPEEAIKLISSAGGIPVLAHPFSLELANEQLNLLLKELKDYGLIGIEIYYPMHSKEMIKEYELLADKYGLIKTGGTDFHGLNKPNIKLGSGLAEMGLSPDIISVLKNKLK